MWSQAWLVEFYINFTPTRSRRQKARVATKRKFTKILASTYWTTGPIDQAWRAHMLKTVLILNNKKQQKTSYSWLAF